MTLLFHVDESRDSAYHFHLGLLTDGRATAALETELDSIVEDAVDKGACSRRDAELHGVEVFHGDGMWKKAAMKERIWVFDEVLRLLDSHGVEVISRGVDLPRFHKKYGKGDDPYTWVFSNLLERLNERLKARDDYGLVISDEQSQYKESLRRQLAQEKKIGTGGYRRQVLRRVVDTAHFVDSKSSRMTQLADMVAFVLRRRASRDPEHDPRLEEVMRRWSGKIHLAVPTPTGQFRSIRYD